MSHIAPLLSDLALILIVAGLVTIIFKRLGQPLVLGYIVAGFLAGPHMPYTPSVEDTTSVNTWSEIGVIFLMFTLGLEFSFKKIIQMGMAPVGAACMIIACMMGIGSGLGHLMGWSGMNSLFLGGMLAMSSTTIIYKAFDDLGLRRQKFAGAVLSVLILEDILGILLMVVLTALAVSRDFHGMELVGSLAQLAFFLILWFIVGMYIVPTFLRRNIKWINRETLLIISLGLCFLLVVIASKAGYSTAFGAFMMGSILAETVEAERIEEVVAPVKDLFGAIFFVSVGMLVNPEILVEYLPEISLITLAIILGQTILGTTAYLLSGEQLKVAMQCGFSMAQIGEFAFIIASLGVSLQVVDSFLYPVVVAVSIITTFLTPYIIRAAVPAYHLLERFIPKTAPQPSERETAATDSSHAAAGAKGLLSKHRQARRKKRNNRQQTAQQRAMSDRSPWRELLIALLLQTGVYMTLSIATTIIFLGFALPLLKHLLGSIGGGLICGVLALLVCAPFLRAIVMRKNHSAPWQALHARGKGTRLGLWMTKAVRFLLATVIVGNILLVIQPHTPWTQRHPLWAMLGAGVLALVVMTAIIRSRRVKYVSIRLERTLRQNMSLRQINGQAHNSGPAYARRLGRHDMHIAQVTLPDNSLWGGRMLRDLDFSHTDGILIAAIIRGDIRINTPAGNTMLFPGDRLDIIGDDEGVEAFSRRLECEVAPATPNDTDHRLHLRRLVIPSDSPLEGRTVAESGIRDTWHCMIVGFEEGMDSSITTAQSNHVIHAGDTMWVVGEEEGLDGLRTMLARE